jgi:hypothetical protein
MRLILTCFSLFFVSLHPVWSQKATYSDAFMDGQMYVTGTVGNTIHAWSVSKKSRKIFHQLTLLTLHIFSSDLKLIDERKISLGELTITRIDFQMENSFYYINITCTRAFNSTGTLFIYRPADDRRLIYKIDAAGNLTDVTHIPGLFTKPLYSSFSPPIAPNFSNIFARKVADSSIVTIDVPWSIKSIGITRVDKNNHLLADTSFKIKEEHEQLEWENRFILSAGSEVYFFCSKLYIPSQVMYKASKAGITLFTISQDGTIRERDIIVYENYSYDLRGAISLESGVLVVPYIHKMKIGLMKLAYIAE